ncbi:NADH-quinone oxidoreductase subunit C [Effusibacillus lacus]|uniref:NADH dehydrogenase n=1 Tax=Effusibacillus lacus TaxID=1348429 RepID=A0A292YN74_9BACL|nr:NADH-quinone oxidoreductase subunit C [Effusibacillus lacus]TCS71218.1 Ni,Fe-hydrogenase III large subunit [Effusibacillus lacus]GAX89844.1 NADH dehydrogenase [Effusibacillus lacus]
MEKNKKHLISRIKQQLGQKLLSVDSYAQNETVITIEKNDLPAVCRFLCKEKEGRLFTMVGSDERDVAGSFALYYVFSFDQFHHFITVKTRIEEHDPTFPSVAIELPAANWYEREVKDLLGIRPQGHPDPRPLVLHGDWPEELHPLRKEFPVTMQVPRVQSRETFMQYEGEDVTEIPVGPIHAGIIEPGHFRFGAVGDTVLHLDARLFYTHRGLEKASEGMPLRKALFLAERICGVCALSHAVSFAQAVENAGQVEIPPRAKYLRTLFLELERLYNHIGDVGNVCAGFGFAVGISLGARLKEELLQLNERIVGHRYLRGIVDLGGTRIDLTPKDCMDIQTTLQKVEAEFRELVEILLSHEIAVNRMSTTGVLTLGQASDLEVVGVAARASGRNIDVRRDQPYAAYDRVKFDVPTYREGDVLARIRVRIDEAFQSFSIIRQVLEQLPAGKIVTFLPELFPYQSAMGWTESPRGETVHWLMIGPKQTVYRYRVRSATYSNWPAVPLTVPGNIVPDFPLINKSFELCYACCDR